MVMSSARQRYRDISPVSLQVEAGAVSSALYCGEVEGLSGGLVESFLVELYRCKLCQFTCGMKDAISGHLLLRHRPLPLTYLGGADRGGGAEGGEGAGLQEASPYRLDLNPAKQSDDDEDFLLYNMLDNMSPPTCDISTEAGLQVAHTCEVSTLFEEDFPLKGGSVDLSCPTPPPATQEEMAQSAHLMTLGLCRISAARPPPLPLSASRPLPPPADDRMTRSETKAAPPPPPALPCALCPQTLASRRLLDVHVRSHRPAGGFGCVCCSWMSDSWEEMEAHWRSHSRRSRSKRRRRRKDERGDGEEKKKKKKKTARPFSCLLCLRTFKSSSSRNAHQQTHSDGWTGRLIGRAGGTEADRSQTCSLQRKKNRREKTQKEKSDEETKFCCSLCHRKFSSKLTLKRHLGVHGGDKPFTCPHCSYSSRLKASLLQHLRTHTGEKPYRCAECPYASIDRSSLLRHSRTHSQEKPYRCQLCDYSSIQKKCLDLHARRHHTGEAFPCQQCEYSSPDRQLLLRHVRRHHAASQHAVL